MRSHRSQASGRQSAREHALVPTHSYDVLADERERLAARAVELSWRGPGQGAKSVAADRSRRNRDASFHLDCLREAAEADAAPLFVDHVTWARVLLEASRLPIEPLKDDLTALDQVLADVLEPAAAAITHDIVSAGLDALTGPLVTPPSFLAQGQSLLCRRYLQGLLEGRREDAVRLVLDAVDAGMPIQRVYLEVFVPTLREVGRLWQIGSIDVGVEHYCSATVQLSISLLYPRVFETPRIERTLVAGCVGDELHEIGLRMVADFFALEGWTTHYLGANVPDDALVDRVRVTGADVVAVSVTITPHLRRARQAVAALREGTDAKILVGGYPMSVVPQLWRQIGADGSAPDGPSAVREANRLLELDRGKH